MADYVGGDMIRGHIDTIILNALIDGDKDTNQIRTEIEARAAGQFQLKQGTFYSALQRIVKQGLVHEYRTTGADGVRRKFFQLTEKGKDHIEKNQSSWTMSRQVINTLLDAQQPVKTVAVQPAQVAEDKIPDFSESKITEFSNLDSDADLRSDNLIESIISSVDEEEQDAELSTQEDSSQNEGVEEAITAIPETFNPDEDEYYNQSETPQTFDDIMEILERLDRNEREEQERKEREEQEKARLEEEAAAAAIAEAEEIERLRAEQTAQEIERAKMQEELPDEFALAELNMINSSTQEEESEPTEVAQESFVKPEPPKQEEMIITTVYGDQEADEPDDYLNSDDIPVQREYKDVLNKIFASSNTSITQPSNTVEPENDRVDDRSNVCEFPAPEEIQEDVVEESLPESDVYVDSFDFEKEIEQEKIMRTAAESTKRNKSAFDYSDIIELSRKEGFKVSTADRTNKNELGKILINKLNFHTSLIFFVLLMLETVVIGLTLESVLSFGTDFYIYFSLIMLSFPIICGLIYYMAPKRTVAEVSMFKSAFETALIITLNLILMILVYTVIIDLDFSSQQAILRNLLLPLALVINVPIYVVIRYSLLEKQMYFS